MFKKAEKRQKPRYKKNLSAYKKGIWAEKCAALYLRLMGFRILRYRFKTPLFSGGEIDLLVQKRTLLVAVEVKYRKTKKDLAEALSSRQYDRIWTSLQYFCTHRFGEENADLMDLRVDLITFSKHFPFFSHKKSYRDKDY